MSKTVESWYKTSYLIILCCESAVNNEQQWFVRNKTKQIQIINVIIMVQQHNKSTICFFLRLSRQCMYNVNQYEGQSDNRKLLNCCWLMTLFAYCTLLPVRLSSLVPVTEHLNRHGVGRLVVAHYRPPFPLKGCITLITKVGDVWQIRSSTGMWCEVKVKEIRGVDGIISTVYDLEMSHYTGKAYFVYSFHPFFVMVWVFINLLLLFFPHFYLYTVRPLFYCCVDTEPTPSLP